MVQAPIPIAANIITKNTAKVVICTGRSLKAGLQCGFPEMSPLLLMLQIVGKEYPAVFIIMAINTEILPI